MTPFAGRLYADDMPRKNHPSQEKLATIGDVERIVNKAVDTLATAIRGGFDDIHERMVTKGEFNKFKAEMYEFKMEMNGFKMKMNEFKTEMYEFRTEMCEFKDNMLEFKAEMCEFKTEMYEFRTEMHDFKRDITEFKGNSEPVLFSLQTDTLDIKRRLGRVEDNLVDLREETASSRIAIIGILKDHETRLEKLEGVPSF